MLRLFIRTTQLFHKKNFVPIVSYHFFSLVEEDRYGADDKKKENISHTHKVKIYDFQCFQFAFCSEISFIKCILNE